MTEVQLNYEINSFTPEEPWTIERPSNHWYAYQADFALESLGRGPGKILIIGSPIFEALEFENEGWEVTYLDVRTPPRVKNFVRGDISTVSLPENFYDAVSSTCVLCHAGMGRYGDLVVEGGDLKALQNIYKTLKKGAKAAITFGPVSCFENQFRVGNMQRVFGFEPAKRMTLSVGFKIKEIKVRDLQENLWVEKFSEPRNIDRHYLSMLLIKD